MATQSMYVVMVREKGLFVVEPVPGQDTKQTIQATLGLGGGYSVGLIALEIPEGAQAVWIAWVEGQGAGGAPYFEYRTFPPSLSESDVNARLAEAGEEALKMNQSAVYWAAEVAKKAAAEAATEAVDGER